VKIHVAELFDSERNRMLVPFGARGVLVRMLAAISLHLAYVHYVDTWHPDQYKLKEHNSHETVCLHR
jgi:hypothetical protein